MTIQKPFLAAVFSRLERVVISDPAGSAATNGKKVWFCVEHCELLSDEQLLCLGMHEASHVALMHPWRREDRDPDRFNVAGDYVIDTPLIKDGYSQHESWMIPEGWVTDAMSTEDVYARLNKTTPPAQGSKGSTMLDPNGEPGDGQGGGEPGHGTGDAGYEACVKNGGDVGDAPVGSPEADMQALVTTAAKMAKACGDDSAMVDFIVSGGLTPTVSWPEVLRFVMTAADRTDFSYARINTRFISSGIYLPALYSDSMGGLIVAMDTSISMSPEELDQAASEIMAIFEDCNPEWVEFVPCSTRVGTTHRFFRGDQIKLECQGRGGTRFKPVFDYVEGMYDRVEAMIYFTDMEGNLDEIPVPEYPVIWANTGRRDYKAPFGEVIKVQA